MGKCPVVPPAGGGEKPFVMGTYTGNGLATQTVSLGFRPSAVLVEKCSGKRAPGTESTHRPHGGLALDGRPLLYNNAPAGVGLEIVADGFTAHTDEDWCYLNDRNFIYYYIAFR